MWSSVATGYGLVHVWSRCLLNFCNFVTNKSVVGIIHFNRLSVVGSGQTIITLTKCSMAHSMRFIFVCDVAMSNCSMMYLCMACWSLKSGNAVCLHSTICFRTFSIIISSSESLGRGQPLEREHFHLEYNLYPMKHSIVQPTEIVHILILENIITIKKTDLLVIFTVSKWANAVCVKTFKKYE